MKLVEEKSQSRQELKVLSRNDEGEGISGRHSRWWWSLTELLKRSPGS